MIKQALQAVPECIRHQWNRPDCKCKDSGKTPNPDHYYGVTSSQALRRRPTQHDELTASTSCRLSPLSLQSAPSNQAEAPLWVGQEQERSGPPCPA